MKTINLSVISGDMTSMSADAYITPQFNCCVSYGGAGGAIARGGAKKGMEAYQSVLDEQSKELPFGTAFITPSGGGNSSYLIHVVTVGSGADNEFDTVQTAVYSALCLADKQGLKTIISPALGTGIIGNLTAEQSAKAIFSAVHKFSERNHNLESFSLVIYGSGTTEFSNVLSTKSYINAVPETGLKEFSFNEWCNGMIADAAANSISKIKE